MSQKKIPVLAILAASFVVPWNNKTRYAQALLFTISILVLVDYLASITGDGFGGETILLYGINLLVYVGFAVTCHRLVLLGGSSVPKYGILGWSSREIRFFLWCVKIGFVFAALIGVVAMIAVSLASSKPIFLPTMIIMMLPVIYFSSRISLLFPATAVDKNHGVKWALKITEGNGFRMVLITVLIPLVMIGVNYSILSFFVENGFVNFVMLVAGYIVTIAEIAAISLSYDYLIKNTQLSIE